MNEKINSFLENFLINIIITFIISGIPWIYSIMNTTGEKYFISIFYRLPSYIYIIFSLPMILYVIYYILNRYIQKRMDEGNYYLIRSYNDPPLGYTIIGKIIINNLLWIIKQNNLDHIQYNYKKFYIDPEPRCPKCEMKLQYKKCHWWYKWSCVNKNCNFVLRTWNHQDKIEDNVRIKVEYDLENK